jgi:dTDP-4-dehydrorhamnose 3,5-epimerase
MIISNTPLQGVVLIEPKVFQDERGYFFETFHQEKLEAFIGKKLFFVQDNESMSNKGVVRGLHFQSPPHSQGKLVRVIQGAVLDVVVDVRKDSKTYGKSYSIELNSENKKQLFVPPGFLHGFATLKDQSIFSYKCTNYYHPESEYSVLWNDLYLKIDWQTKSPLISEKDKFGLLFETFESPF